MYVLLTLFYFVLLSQSSLQQFQKMAEEVKFPLFAQRFTINITINNNILDIYILTRIKFYELSQLKGKQAILIDSYMHAREPYSFSLIKALFLQIVAKNSQLQDFMKNGVFIFYPFVNVDAYKIYQTSSSENLKDTLRKNMNKQLPCKQNKGEVGGVDINRNFPAQFDTVKTSKNPCSQEYHGRYPFSQRQANVFKSIYQNFKVILAIDIHSYGNEWIYPYASDATGKKIKNHQLYNFYKIIIEQLSIKGKKIKSCKQSLGYVADGVYIDWALDQNALSLAYQIGRTFRSDQQKEIQASISNALEDFYLIFKKLIFYNYEVEIYSNKITIKSKTLLTFNIKVNISSNLYEMKLNPGQQFSFNRTIKDERFTLEILQLGKYKIYELNPSSTTQYYLLIIIIVICCLIVFLFIIKWINKSSKLSHSKIFIYNQGNCDQQHDRTNSHQLSISNSNRQL